MIIFFIKNLTFIITTQSLFQIWINIKILLIENMHFDWSNMDFTLKKLKFYFYAENIILSRKVIIRGGIIPNFRLFL